MPVVQYRWPLYRAVDTRGRLPVCPVIFFAILLDAADRLRNILTSICWQEDITSDVTSGGCPHKGKRSEGGGP